MKINTKTLTFTALLLALGIALPHLVHMLGGQPAGAMWLPIHLVALIAGLSFGPIAGVTVGALTPLLRFAIFGMPPMPLVWFMVIEVAVYGAAAGLFRKPMKLPVWASLALSQVAGRAVRMLTLFVAARLFGMDNLPAATVVFTSELVLGLPGLALQWAVVPPTVKLLDQHTGGRHAKRT